jgi:TrmH family RNA methyltransferase
VERITSRKHALVTAFREAARGRAAREHILLDGLHLVHEALKSAVTLDVVAIDRARLAADDRALAEVADAAAVSGARLVEVPTPVMQAMSPASTPSGVVALARLSDRSVSDVVTGRRSAGAHALCVALVDLQDPGNVGAIVRAAEAGGADGVVACGATADPFGWKALRGAMGSTFRLPIARTPEVAVPLAAMRDAGLSLVATSPKAGAVLWDADFRSSVAILVGGEGAGLSPDVVALADRQVRIPMIAPVESLNAAVAAAVIIYEVSRQRRRTTA